MKMLDTPIKATFKDTKETELIWIGSVQVKGVDNALCINTKSGKLWVVNFEDLFIDRSQYED